MTTRRVMAAIGAGTVSAVSLGAQPGAGGRVYPVRMAGHVYVNVATGEVKQTPGPAVRLGDLYWGDSGGCGGLFAQDDPARNPSGGVDALATLAVHWGDLPRSEMNGYQVSYATNIGCDTLGTGVAGLSIVNTFLGHYDGLIDPGGASANGLLAVELESIAGGDCTLGTSVFQGWAYTVDLEGTGFEIGWDGADLDGDGLIDFAFGYEFIQAQAGPKGIIGPVLVRPASLGGTGSATGCPDRYDWFNDRGDEYLGGYWFGGGDCTLTPPRPYASFSMSLYGTVEVDRCALIDYTGNGVIDFADYLEFLNRYDAQDPSADLNGDGVVDFADYLEFLNLYEACA